MSTTIDNKVVNMSFNNANFESNVRTSINTIDKLKGSLNSLSGTNLNKLNNTDVTQVANSFEQVGSAIDTVRVKFSMLDVAGATVVANLTTSLMGFAKRTLGFVTNAITQGGINRAMKIQNARFQLNGLLHDAAEVEKVMEDVDYGVADTAYGLDAAAQVASQLAASGIRAGDSMKAYLRGISGVAAMTNSTYEEIGQIFTRVAGNGRLMAIDLQSLAARGMNAAATLGEAMGKTEEEIRDMVSKGKISFDDFAKAMDNAFGEHAKDANRTFSGVMANIRSALAKIGADFVTPFVVENSPFIQFLDDIRKKLNEFRKWLKPASELVANSMVNMFGKWRDFLSSFDLAGFLSNYSLVDYLTNVGKRFKEMNIDIESLKKTIDGCKAALEIFGRVLKTIFEVLVSIATSKAMVTVINGFIKITSVIGEMIRAVADAFTGEGIAGIFNKLLEGLSLFVSGVFNIFSGMGFVLSGIKDFIVGLLTSVGDAIRGVVNWIKETITPIDVLSGILASGLAGILLKIIQLITRIKWMLANGGILSIFFGNGGSTSMAKVSTTTIMNSIQSVLGALTTSLKTLTTSIRATTLVAIAAAITLLVNSLVRLSEINILQLSSGLMGITVLMNALMVSFTSFSKVISAEGMSSGKFLSFGAAVLLFAESINILATAVNKIGELSLSGLAKGLIGIGTSMAMLVKAMEGLAKVKVTSLQAINVAVILALAEACKLIADALKTLGDISWTGMVKSLLGLITTVHYMTTVIEFMSEWTEPIKTLPATAASAILAESFSNITAALKEIGDMSWEAVIRGLIGLYSALGILTQVLSVFTGMKNISSALAGSISILIVTQSLGDIAEALKRISGMSWEGLARGLFGMGVALAELVIAIGVLGTLNEGIAGIFGSLAILIAVQALSDIAEALASIGRLSWDQISRGLFGMGVALAELASVTLIIGGIAPLLSIVGGVSLLIAVQSLEKLADAFAKFGMMSWDQIGNGVLGMLSALSALAYGGLINTVGILGDISINIVAESLISLAEAFAKFGELNVNQIKAGFVAMLSAFGALGFGGIVNSLGILGSIAIEKVAKPLGDLAESMMKWENVRVPSTLMKDLAQLASGIGSFFGGFGVDSFIEIVEPMGVLAESMAKWKDVSIPEDIGDGLKHLGTGVEAFLFAGWGADAISVVAEPLGVLADSISKWKELEIPEDLGVSLAALAVGVFEFTKSIIGAFAVGEVAEPLGVLADSVSKWKDVEVPEDIGDSLARLSKALDGFGSKFIVAWSIEDVAEPLGILADSLSKWKDVTVPTDLGESLSVFGNDVNNFADQIKKIVNNDYSNMNKFSDAVTKLQESISSITPVDSEIITSFIQGISSLSEINLNADSLGRLADGLSVAISSLMDTISSGISNRTDEMRLQGEAVINALNDGFNTYSSTIDLINQVMNDIVDTINLHQEDMRTAGLNLVMGLKNGIESNSHYAVAAAQEMANAVSAAARAALEVRSPSRVFQRIGEFIPKGMALGISSLTSAVVDSVKDMSSSAISGTQEAISRLSDLVQNDIDVNPTIRPVLDLSDVRSGAGIISDIFADSPILGTNMNVGNISRMMNSRDQKTTNLDVVNAINNLRKDIDSNPRNSYIINGITYDDGSGLSDAFETIIRYARVERRA